jgi:hypothetical protein
MTPGLDWRADYADWPRALAKLEFCEQTLADLRDHDPAVTAEELDEDVGELTTSLEQYYRKGITERTELPRGLEGSLRTIFEDLGDSEGGPRRPASELIRKLEREISASVYRWTGHFPERTRLLVRHLADLADRLQLGYPEGRRTHAVAALTALVTALAMNHVRNGSYVP